MEQGSTKTEEAFSKASRIIEGYSPVSLSLSSVKTVKESLFTPFT